MKRPRLPLHHVSIFWIGLLPVMFLLALWGDSRRVVTRWSRCEDGRNSTTIILWGSWLQRQSLGYVPVAGHQDSELPKFQELKISKPGGRWERTPQSTRGITPWFPPLQHENVRHPIGKSHELVDEVYRIPLWWIVLGYLPLWLIPSAWLARRKVRRWRREEEAVRRMTEEEKPY